jgi:hypothetical protein
MLKRIYAATQGAATMHTIAPLMATGQQPTNLSAICGPTKRVTRKLVADDVEDKVAEEQQHQNERPSGTEGEKIHRQQVVPELAAGVGPILSQG